MCFAPQIAKEVKRFAKSVGLTCVAVYGGSGVANQITELKRGTEIVVCTPGRMIDILGEFRAASRPAGASDPLALVAAMSGSKVTSICRRRLRLLNCPWPRWPRIVDHLLCIRPTPAAN